MLSVVYWVRNHCARSETFCMEGWTHTPTFDTHSAVLRFWHYHLHRATHIHIYSSILIILQREEENPLEMSALKWYWRWQCHSVCQWVRLLFNIVAISNMLKLLLLWAWWIGNVSFIFMLSAVPSLTHSLAPIFCLFLCTKTFIELCLSESRQKGRTKDEETKVPRDCLHSSDLFLQFL